MAALTPYQRAAREGIRAAQREHQRIGTEFTRRVEIFDVIEDERIWLLFQRLRNLYGAYERYGVAAGIIVNSQHPLTLQRYTAAHEYGHHALGHAASADDETRIYRRSQDPREVAAQAFAGEFLMPLQLVNYTLRTMGLSGRYFPLTARQVYQLALDLGVSYGAAVTQLVGQHKLTVPAGQRLRRESPLAVKTGLAGLRPADSWADVWLLDESQEGRQFSPRLRDEIHVMLAETPSTGYVWQLVDAAPSVLALIDDQFETRRRRRHRRGLGRGMSPSAWPSLARAGSGSRNAGRGSRTARRQRPSRRPSTRSHRSPVTPRMARVRK